jgi:hypothetical protein
MSRADAARQSTMKLNTFGDSDRFFDFVLAGDGVRFAGNTQYMISEDSRGRIESFSFASANESLPRLLARLTQTEADLLRAGWRYDSGSPRVASFPRKAEDVRRTDSGAIDAFRFVKGDLMLTVTPYAKWGGRRPKVFWRSMNVSLAEAEAH